MMQDNMTMSLIASKGLAFQLEIVDMHALDIEIQEWATRMQRDRTLHVGSILGNRCGEFKAIELLVSIHAVFGEIVLCDFLFF